MALWPFGKKDKDTPAEENSADKLREETAKDHVEEESAAAAHEAEGHAQEGAAPAYAESPDTPGDAAAAAGVVPFHAIVHDAVNGESGPFDGDAVDINDFDFGEFTIGILDLGSLRIPLPQDSQVQVEMGENGPKMLHIVTRVGRMTPVAFAAPRSSGQWAEAGNDLMRGIEADGLATHTEEGPWGTEIVGTNPNGSIRIIGVEGPRWLLRFTLAAPAGLEEQLTSLAHQVIARTFVYRGDTPILAGNSLPVTMPEQLVEQVRLAMEQREEQAREEQLAAEAGPGVPDPQAEDDAAQQLRDLDGKDKK